MDKYHILIVEDRDNLATLFGEMLKRKNVDSVRVSDGQFALEHLSKYKPALVLTDFHMPRVDGGELIRSSLSLGYKMPFVLMSGGMTVDELEAQAIKVGLPAGYTLPKPFTHSSLYLKLEKALRMDPNSPFTSENETRHA